MSLCDWCHASLANKFAYNLTTHINGKAKVFHIGGQCCISKGRHADFANLYGCPPMYFEIVDSPPLRCSKRVRSSPVRYTPA